MYRDELERRQYGRKWYWTHRARQRTWMAEYRRTHRKALSRYEKRRYAANKAADCTYRAFRTCQKAWARAMAKAGVYCHQSFLDALGMPWKNFCDMMEARLPADWDWSKYGTAFEFDHIIPWCAWNLHDPIERAACGFWVNLTVIDPLENEKKNGKFDPAKRDKYLEQFRRYAAGGKRRP